MGVPKTSDYIQIKIKIPKPGQEPPASSKAPSYNLKDMDVLCSFKIKIEGQNLEDLCIKDRKAYTNQNPKPQSRTSSILQSPKLVLKGHACSLCLQRKDGEQKFKIWVYQRPVTISK